MPTLMQYGTFATRSSSLSFLTSFCISVLPVIWFSSNNAFWMEFLVADIILPKSAGFRSYFERERYLLYVRSSMILLSFWVDGPGSAQKLIFFLFSSSIELLLTVSNFDMLKIDPLRTELSGNSSNEDLLTILVFLLQAP